MQYRRTGQLLIALTSLLQTIPSLALLCFLIPILGIGARPTIFALFLYGLLPVSQSTTTGLLSLDSRLIETARILGLTKWQRLRLIELPLASRYILAGIKTTAVINVATATIAALIGAGGYGRYITSVSYTHLDVYKRQRNIGSPPHFAYKWDRSRKNHRAFRH